MSNLPEVPEKRMAHQIASPKWPLALLLATAVLLTACAGVGSASGSHYRCENGLEFSVRFVDDTAVLEGNRGYSLLYRDAGGQGPQQTVYSSPALRAEFGMGRNGKEALLHYPLLPLTARCVRD